MIRRIRKIKHLYRILNLSILIFNFAHILLYDGQSNSEFITIEYVSGAYEIWDTGPGLVSLTLGPDVETATIDIDSDDIIWLAYESEGDINVRWSSSDYSTWSSEIVLGTGVDAVDDICAVTAFGGDKIGVLWSNQNDDEFGFAYHNDGVPASNWTFETAISDNKVADDHINFAVHSNGTIYAAVKTSYDTDGEPTIALLVRSPGGAWQLVDVRYTNGTRPIALLNETVGVGIIIIAYTQSNGGDDIMYKSSYISPFSFYPGEEGEKLIENFPEDWNNVTSTKQNFDSEVVILAGKQTSSSIVPWTGLIASGITPTPVELSSFDAIAMEDRIILNWQTETEISNYGFDIERLVLNSGWEILGFVEGHGNSNSPKNYSFIDYDISRAGYYKYRLRQIDNDGQFEYSNVISVNVGTPASFYLSQNYPNPFNPSTKIDYSVPQASKVSLKIYDILGGEVAILVDEFKEAGTYTETFDASNLPGGIYFYTIAAGNFMETKKMSLVK